MGVKNGGSGKSITCNLVAFQNIANHAYLIIILNEKMSPTHKIGGDSAKLADSAYDPKGLLGVKRQTAYAAVYHQGNKIISKC